MSKLPHTVLCMMIFFKLILLDFPAGVLMAIFAFYFFEIVALICSDLSFIHSSVHIVSTMYRITFLHQIGYWVFSAICDSVSDAVQNKD